MRTSIQVFTELWDWRSPAWWVALAATVVYVIVARRRHASARQVGLFAISAAAFCLALASPLAVLAGQYLFSAHMAQHLLLLLIVPLCAMLAWPSPPTRPASSLPPRPWMRAGIPVGWAAGVGAMWFWHVPALCTASMQNPVVFDVQVVSLIAAGAAFWWPVFGAARERRMQPHVAAGYLFSGCVGCSLLGIYITFSPVAVCPLYAAPAGSPELMALIRNEWGLTHRLDQQIGGLLMWVPACMVYLGAILASFSSWYQVPERSDTASGFLATE